MNHYNQPNNHLHNTDGDWYDAEISANVISGHVYAIVLESTSNGKNAVQWRRA